MSFKLNKPRKILSWDYSYLVTLPIRWIKHHEVGKGDYLELTIDKDNNLVLKPLRREEVENEALKTTS